MTEPTTDQQLDLDEIEARAAAVYEYATVTDPEGQTAADQLAGTDVPALVAELRRHRAELAATEMFAPQQCPAGTHADWLVDSEYAHACPWCQIEGLRAQLADQADADTVADRAAKAITAMGDDLRAVTGERNRYRNAWHNACTRAVDARSDAEEAEAASVPPGAPLRASHASSVSESAQSPGGAPVGSPRDSGTLEPEVPLPDRLEAVLTERFTELGNPYSRMSISFQGPDGWPASKEVGPHDVAEVLRELLAAAAVETHIVADDSSDPTTAR